MAIFSSVMYYVILDFVVKKAVLVGFFYRLIAISPLAGLNNSFIFGWQFKTPIASK